MRMAFMLALVLVAGGGMFLACGGGLGGEAGPGTCDGGSCEAGGPPEATSIDTFTASDVGSTASDGGRDAGRLAPCDDGGLPGALDPSFGEGGIVYVHNADPKKGFSAGDAVLIQPDGKTVLGGESGTSNDPRFLLARLTATGALDPTFGDGGLAFAGFSLPERAFLSAIAVLADDHVLAAGYASDYVIAKFEPNGSLDPTFGAGGIVRVDIGTYDKANAMVLQADGKIVVVGWSAPVAMIGGKPVPGRPDVSAVRLHPDGSLDPSFGSAGKVLLSLATQSSATAVALDGAGRIVVGGHTGKNRDFAVFRLTSAGAMDATFGSGGVATRDFGDEPEAFRGGLFVQPDGKYLLTGLRFDPVADALARFLPDGAPDPAFGKGGGVVVPNPSDYYVRSHAAAVAGGRVTVAGSWSPSVGATAPPGFGVSRYCL
jgi:uncharacterized delta-60 repeat protein